MSARFFAACFAVVVAGAAQDRPAPLAAQEAAAVPAGQAAVLEAADRARTKGEPDAPLRIVEVSDFQCPFCARFHRDTWPVVDSLYVESGIARYLWISFPNSRHDRAWPAIEAAFCAGAAGRFWEMHAILFETQDVWSEADDAHAHFLESGARAGVEPESFAACLRADQPAPLQVSDYESALRSGITSTPFFIVGDSLAIQGAVSADRFRAAVDSVLEARDLTRP
ncbi:MAG: DsbA family protein [Gemmatimonadota bacterium]